MKNTFVLNKVFVFILIHLQTCQNYENYYDFEQDYDNIVPMIDYINNNSETDEKVTPRIDYFVKNHNNTSVKTDVVDYGNESDYITEFVNETDDDICEKNTFLLNAFFKITAANKNDESEGKCDDCIPGMEKGENHVIHKGKDKVFQKLIEQNVTIENKTTEHNSVDSQQNETIPQVGLNEQENLSTSNPSNTEANNTLHFYATQKPYLRVVNGRPAELGDVPYQVAFKMLQSRRTNKYVTFCGGVIIGPSKLVSAAHCFEDGRKPNLCETSGSRKASKKTLRRTKVVAGNLLNVARFNEGGQWRSLKSMYYPVKYKFPRLDISVGFLKKPFKFNSYVNQIPYERKFVDRDRQSCLVSGYGRINKYERSDKLLLADLSILSNSHCSKLHRQRMKRFVCTDNVPSDIEKGDSGGPLVCSNVLVGIVSGHRYGAGSFFTRVSSYSKYIAAGKATTLTCNYLVHFVYVLFVCFIIFTI